MDRSWMRADRRTKEYQRGVEEFLMYAFEHGFDENKINCPCVKCAHSKSWNARRVRDHLFLNGIDETYTCWIWHGENVIESGSSQSVDQIPIKTENSYAHLCLLQNTTAVRPYFDEHMSFLMTKYPEHENDEVWLKKKQNEIFPRWFQEKIASDLLNEKKAFAYS
ncbi:hypothetical protein POM88_050277 [Heracleum sosnowskyi]|uniref:Transposase-associated domain-containing protein n=1 Tax=Heracleum sosnowskyi TaxID=360622 RepID=A0AAD8GYF3_9APIA|nr:hypothetical protein POM88_050277 [Heracleum sosnowskyi]